MNDINIKVYSKLIQTHNRNHYLKKPPNYAKKVAVVTSSSIPKLVAEAILEAITSKDPEVRYLVGEDAGEILKVRKNASDKEFENWMYKRILRERQGQQQGL